MLCRRFRALQNTPVRETPLLSVSAFFVIRVNNSSAYDKTPQKLFLRRGCVLLL